MKLYDKQEVTLGGAKLEITFLRDLALAPYGSLLGHGHDPRVQTRTVGDRCGGVLTASHEEGSGGRQLGRTRIARGDRGRTFRRIRNSHLTTGLSGCGGGRFLRDDWTRRALGGSQRRTVTSWLPRSARRRQEIL